MEKYKSLEMFIVDDDPLCREVHNQYLLNMGFTRINIFESGQQCINELALKPDIILLDHDMSPINGMDTLRRIKVFNPDIYVIYISSKEEVRVAVDAFENGAFDYVMKSDMEETLLAGIIRRIITIMDKHAQKIPVMA